MKDLAQARILVTGGAGFIGSHLVEALLGAGASVSIIDDLSTGRREHVSPRARLEVADLRSADVGVLLEEEAPDVVVHLAAQANVRRSVLDPVADAQSNVVASLRLLEACKSTGIRRLLFASSGGAVYGEQTEIPTPEESRARPASPYGAAKLAIEHYLGVYRTTCRLDSIALRFGNVYGPRQLPEGEAGVVAIFLERMLRGEELVVFGDGSQTRDYVYVGDVVGAITSAIGRLLEDRPAGPINVGTGFETSVSQVIAALERALDRRAIIRHDPAIPGELARNALAVRRAEHELDWRPGTTLAEGIARTAAFFVARAEAR